MHHALPLPASLVLAGLALAPLTACGPEEPSGADRSVRASGSVETDVLDLITAVTPQPATVGAGEQHGWFTRRRATLERLRAAGPETGLEALRMYRERERSIPEIRIGLLDVAAHGAPQETRPLLVELVTTFGDDPGLRAAAAELLGKTSPETALEVLEPILRGERSGVTHPPEDQMLEAWFEAAQKLEVDCIPLLCLVATDMSREHAARSFAAKRLGEIPSVQGRQALEQLLVESSGNHMIRRYAAQSLQTTLPGEEFCELMRRTIDREADLPFQTFLDRMLVAHCR